MNKKTISFIEKQSLNPRIVFDKIVVNAGVGRLSTQPNFEDKTLLQINKDLSSITGQKPAPRSAKKSIASFKTREGQIVGVQVTLRRKKMFDFFERLIKIVLPRVRDFHGLDPKSVDQHGILNIGLKEQLVFPEVNPEHSPISFSLGINIVPKIKDRAFALEAYRKLGVPLKK